MNATKDPARGQSARHWYQFGLRSLLVTVLAYGVMLGLWTAYVEPFRAQRQAMSAIEKLGGDYRTRPGGSDWLRDVLFLDLQDVVHADLADCDDPRAYIEHLLRCRELETLAVGGPNFTDQHLLRFEELRSLRGLVLDSAGVTDRGLLTLRSALPNLTIYKSDRRAMPLVGGVGVYGKRKAHPLQAAFGDKFFQVVETVDFTGRECGDRELANLARLEHLADLEYVELDSSRVTDAGLRHLRGMGVKRLELGDTNITDAGLAQLGKLPQLEFLLLNETGVGDAGLKHLTGLTRLKSLWLRGTQVTDEGMDELRKALPACRISRSCR